MMPIILKKNDAVVPCGTCPKCKSRRVSAWSFRLMEEEKISDSTYFVTLTYNNETVPISSKTGYMSLQKRDLQLFFKRLRKAHGKVVSQKIRYYAVGEYGGKSQRPHYHIILFGAIREFIEKAWNNGNCHIGTVTAASVGYTLKYINKGKSERYPRHKNDDRKPEFSVMSKGLGVNYLTSKAIKWHKVDLENRMYCTTDQGIKLSMPRYYKDRIYNSEERKKIQEATIERLRKKEKLLSHKEWNLKRIRVNGARQRAIINNSKKDNL